MMIGLQGFGPVVANLLFTDIFSDGSYNRNCYNQSIKI